MSYILEALKKIDQKREQKAQTKSLTFLEVPGPGSKQSPRWLYPVIAALLLNAGIMVWWIGPWRTDKKETAARPPAVLQSRPMEPGEAGLGEPKIAGRSQEVLQPKSLPNPPGSVVEKEGRKGSSPGAGKARNADQISDPPSAIKKDGPEYDSDPIGLSRSKTASKPREGTGGKRVIYYKDGTTESCDDVQVTENFIQCNRKGGGSLINLNRIDLEKTLPEKAQ
jgi:hypothetical protein